MKISLVLILIVSIIMLPMLVYVSDFPAETDWLTDENITILGDKYFSSFDAYVTSLNVLKSTIGYFSNNLTFAVNAIKNYIDYLKNMVKGISTFFTELWAKWFKNTPEPDYSIMYSSKELGDLGQWEYVNGFMGEYQMYSFAMLIEQYPLGFNIEDLYVIMDSSDYTLLNGFRFSSSNPFLKII